MDRSVHPQRAGAGGEGGESVRETLVEENSKWDDNCRPISRVIVSYLDFKTNTCSCFIPSPFHKPYCI